MNLALDRRLELCKWEFDAAKKLATWDIIGQHVWEVTGLVADPSQAICHPDQWMKLPITGHNYPGNIRAGIMQTLWKNYVRDIVWNPACGGFSYEQTISLV